MPVADWSWAVAAAAWLTLVGGHGGLVYPPARNSFDRTLPRYFGGKGSKCNCGNETAGCERGLRASMDGQGCFWFSQVR